MVDLWGPGAFGAADAAASRPAYTPGNLPGDADTWYKDCSSPADDDGTEWKSAALNMLLVQMRKVVRGSPLSATNLSDDLLARSIQSGLNFAVATGSANAWVFDLTLAPLSYDLGLPFEFIAPATNTSTTVNANAEGVGDKRVKKRDGADPAVGDLIAGTLYRGVYDGASIRILTPLISDVVAALSAAPTPPQLNFFELATQNTQNVGSAVITVVNDFAVSTSKPSDAVFSAGGLITIGPKTAGVWAFNQTYSPSQVGGASSVTQAYLQKNGISYNSQTISGTFATNSGTMKVVAGDVLRMAVYQNSGGNQKNQHAPALPFNTTFSLYHISA